MFVDSWLDSAWAHDSRRGWTTVLSFAAQAAAVAFWLALPLIYAEGVPALQSTATIVAPGPASGSPVHASQHPAHSDIRVSTGLRLVQPGSSSGLTVEIHDEVPQSGDVGPSVESGTGDRWKNDVVVNSSLNAEQGVFPPPPVPPAIARPPLISHMMEGNLLHKVQPEYPPLARQARVQGAVVLQAIISREGPIENLQVTSGPSMLVPAAIEAVRQWRYRPYFLNGIAVEVETQVTVNFVLGGGQIDAQGNAGNT